MFISTYIVPQTGRCQTRQSEFRWPFFDEACSWAGFPIDAPDAISAGGSRVMELSTGGGMEIATVLRGQPFFYQQPRKVDPTACPYGMYTYTYKNSDIGGPVLCHLSEDGDGDLVLEAAFIGGVECSALFSGLIVLDIERLAWPDVQRQIAERNDELLEAW